MEERQWGKAHREGARGPACVLVACVCLLFYFVLFGPSFQNAVPDSGLEGSGLWSVETEERRVSEWLCFGEHAGGGGSTIFLFLLFLLFGFNGFQQGSL